MSEKDGYFVTKDLTKSFGGLTAVKDLNLSVEQNKITGLIGPNGAGKTTAFNLIAGYHRPTSGQIYFKGRDITGLPPHKIVKLGMSRTFQDLRLFGGMTALENVLVGIQDRAGERLMAGVIGGWNFQQRTKQEIEQARELLKLVHLDGKENEICENMGYGEHKLLALARVLATGADFLMLDEPVAGLPPGSVDEVLEVVTGLVKQGKTILLVEHNMEAAMSICNWIFVLNFGELLTSGTPEEIRKHEEVIRVYLGV